MRTAALVVLGLLCASCHSWGFFRPVETPPAFAEDAGTGLRWRDLREGQGREATIGSRVKVHYTGKLEDGTPFDSSHDRDAPFEFVLGRGEVIRGWEQGMTGQRVGGLREITIPPELAYGDQGRAGAIPPNATLVLEVELLEVTQL